MTTSKYPVMTLEGVKEAIREVHYNRPGVEIQAIACVAQRCTYAMSDQGIRDGAKQGAIALREGVPMPKKIVCAIGAWFEVNGITDFDGSDAGIAYLLEAGTLAAASDDDRYAIGALQRQHDAAAHCIRSDADRMATFKAAVGIV